MSIYSNVTEQYLIYVRKLAERHRNQRALKIKNRILKQTHDRKLAEILSTISKKLEEIDKSTKNLGEIEKESICGSENDKEKVPSEIDNIQI